MNVELFDEDVMVVVFRNNWLYFSSVYSLDWTTGLDYWTGLVPRLINMRMHRARVSYLTGVPLPFVHSWRAR